ncbi:sulfurtransferase [Corynebacterium comes]|uniref:3-mercaptopyruvate sulfurtransferase n=1 Tax=Corynebacterium comes TaxID=2675218 RepID=A0A6B8VKC1_9CORY|nr:sulfurtransferase [Corynebacterium comes]QGU04533.1 3-mercaptopyruvate sulfurtransferase [Corynebacterium comes]
MNPLITAEELATLLRDNPPVILCASMGPHPPKFGIPGSHLADLEGDFSDRDSPLPHTAPMDLTGLFGSYGVSDGTTVVIYDDQAGATAPRVWWLAEVAGIHARVLDGGLPAWRLAGGAVEELVRPTGRGTLTAGGRPHLLHNAARVAEGDRLIVDARSAGRFAGTEPEPRAGLRAGHIPGSVNLPYVRVYDGAGRMLPEGELRELFHEVVDKEEALTFSCGSGVTACVTALAATVAGYRDLAVYEGSWAEWGRL